MRRSKVADRNAADVAQIAATFAMIGVVCYVKNAPLLVYAALAALFAAMMFSGIIYKYVNLPVRCLTPIALGSFFVAIYFEIYQSDTIFDQIIRALTRYDLKEFLAFAHFNPSYKEQFYSAISTLFAIIVALALVKGLGDIDELKRTFSAEAYGVRSIWHYLEFFEKQDADHATAAAKSEIMRLMTDYAENVGGGSDTKEQSENGRILKRCRAAILQLTPVDRDDKIAHAEIIKSLEAVGILRSKRIGSGGSQVSAYLMGALWLMSLALILPFMAEPLCVDEKYIAVEMGPNLADLAKLPKCSSGLFLNPQRFSQYYMIFTTVSFFSFLMLMLHDVSTPDQGFWRVDPKVFKDLHDDFQKEIVAEATHGPPISSPIPTS